jgi:Ribonuclease G/E
MAVQVHILSDAIDAALELIQRTIAALARLVKIAREVDDSAALWNALRDSLGRSIVRCALSREVGAVQRLC